jgi:hypothetical protein
MRQKRTSLSAHRGARAVGRVASSQEGGLAAHPSVRPADRLGDVLTEPLALAPNGFVLE